MSERALSTPWALSNNHSIMCSSTNLFPVRLKLTRCLLVVAITCAAVAADSGSYMTFNNLKGEYPKYGNLERRSHDDGRLEFKPEVNQTETLSIYLRLSPRFDYRYTSPTEFEMIPFDIVSASVLSFAFSLDYLSDAIRNQTHLHILVNADDSSIVMAFKIWSESLFSNRTALLNIVECPTGKVLSKQCMLDLVVDHAVAGLSEKSILYFIENDYLHHASATQEMMDIFASHNPCIAVPYDYADRYSHGHELNADLHTITLIAGKHRHWRSIRSTTSTFAIRLENFILYFDHLPFPMPSPGNDFRASQILYSLGVSIVSPLPSLAAHINSFDYIAIEDKLDKERSSEFVPLYFNWFSMARNLHRHALNMKVNMWSLLGNPVFQLRL